MKNDPHLIESEVPMIEGQSYTAKCGKEISRAKQVMMWDVIQMGIPTKDLRLRCCRKCWAELIEDYDPVDRKLHYLYGVVPAGQVESEEREV